ncbi:conjugal transfer protein [Fictibacillus enclensis]|uniref:conjugal transfer protein n=1 Tax=Fictibacillus enclensis TaxID=1017270 RepID=UPI0025A07CF9|nr:conjugal transfer protein [Fictibacillus enclensis]MDM5197031.1 conjugal transfer protein [Fictibacillus enclensis]
MLQKENESEKKEESFFRAVHQKINRVKKPGKAKKVVPRDRSKMVAVTLWAILSSLLILSLLAVLLSVNTRSVINEVRRDFNKPTEDEQIQMSVTAAENFLSGFIHEYVNVKNDMDSIEQRKEKLESYMVTKVDGSFEDERRYDLTGLKGNRILNEYNLYNVKKEKGYNLFQYKVNYTNQFPVEKEVEKTVKDGKKEKKVKEKVMEIQEAEKQLLLNIPVANKGDAFAVTAVPYFTPIYDLKGKIISFKKEHTREEYTGSKKESIEKFLHSFFEKYASQKKEDMVYMMKKPESLQDSLSFGYVENVKIFETKKGFEVSCDVEFKEKENEIPVKEPFTLELTETSGQFYVKDLKHQ